MLRHKAKLVLGLLFLLVIGLAAGSVIYPSYLLKQAEQLQADGQPEAALAIYKRIFTSFPIHPDAPTALYRAADMGPHEMGDGSMFVFPSGSLNTGNDAHVSAEQSIKWLQRLREDYPDSMEGKNFTPRRLSVLYALTGQKAEAEKLLAGRPELRGSYDRALQFARGDQQIGPAQLTGQAFLDGKPMPGLHVYLRLTSDHSMTSTGDGLPHVVTDANGEYRFAGVLPGEYQVGVRFRLDQVEGYYWPVEYGESVDLRDAKEGDPAPRYDIHFKPRMITLQPQDGDHIKGEEITFRWQPEPNAAFYRIALTSLVPNSAMTMTMQQKIEQPEVTYRLDDLRAQTVGTTWSGGGEYMEIDPRSVLGMIYPGGTFSYVVNAYDDQERLLNSSYQYGTLGTDKEHPVFTVDDRDQLEGDRLVIEKRYDEAVAAYVAAGDNPNALRSLAVLTFYGGTRKNGDPTETPLDPQKTISLLERLPEHYDRDKQLLALSYKALGQDAKANALFCERPDLFKRELEKYALTCK